MRLASALAPGNRPHLIAVAVAVVAVAAWSAAMLVTLRAASLPDQATGMMVAVFAPGTEDQAAFARVLAAGGRPVRRTDPPLAWVVEAPVPGLAARLRAEGALLVLRDFPFGPVLAGCSGLGAPVGS